MKVIREKIPQKVRNLLRVIALVFLLLMGVGIGFSVWYFYTYQGKFNEGIWIDSVDVSEKTKDEAIHLLVAQPKNNDGSLILYHNENQATASADALGVYPKYQETIDLAYSVGKSDNLLTNYTDILNAILNKASFSSPLAYDESKVREFVTLFAQSVNTQGQFPVATIQNGQVSISAGKKGYTLNIQETIQTILNTPISPSAQVAAVVDSSGLELDTAQLEEAKMRAQKYLGKTIVATADSISVSISDSELIPLLRFPEGIDRDSMAPILDKLTKSIERPAQNAEFTYDQNTLKVTRFRPDLDGLTLDKELTQEQLNNVLVMIEQGNSESILPISVQYKSKKADVPLESLNNLGIKHRLGLGESYYKGSIPGRVHNVTNASNILNNIIIKPGDTFSFNKALGEVSSATGFKPAYIIQSGRTVLGDGGGVCQVSTTLFRALLDSGLNISLRRPHSYRVGYYEQEGRVGSYYIKDQPGFDATVFSGEVDLRFVNDSPGHILIHMETNPETQHMIVSIYGTSDGRYATVSEYTKWDARRAPAAQYFDDPTLPPGKLIQIDWAVGGVKSSFKHTVKDKEGKMIKETTYYSNYIPWAAKYRRGV